LFSDVSWWKYVDLLGINAYFPLRSSLRPSQTDHSLLQELQRGWVRTLRQIDAARQVKVLTACWIHELPE
jgi:hypothetical protein